MAVEHAARKASTGGLALLALGVVYGDIGTSPLYAVRESFHFVAPTAENVYGILSLITWSLILVISIWYLMFILRADNRGEGGILALMALVHPEHRPGRGSARGMRVLLVMLGLFGAALLYGDGMITPAISVLSAVEGLSIVTHAFEPFVVPLTVGILIGLFLVQKRGTAGVARLFWPVTLTWFVVLGTLGVYGILQAPQVLQSVNPWNAVRFFMENEVYGFLALGAVFLVVTGGEALYADMGHFGPKPIRFAWYTIVLPALLLNYYGQGALLLVAPEAVTNPFYLLAPRWALLPLVVLATMATIIASQAVISGAFSVTMQAVHLGYSPRLRIEHTSATERGQIYMPEVNWILMVATVGLVLGFRSSSNLAAAYGVAITTTMVITTLLFSVVVREIWGWKWWATAALVAVFISIDMAFFGANIVKVPDGGWFPLVVAGLVFALMTTWRKGRKVLGRLLDTHKVPIAEFLAEVRDERMRRVPGTAVFPTGNSGFVPMALLRNLEHNKVLHEQVVLLTIVTEEVSHVHEDERLRFEDLGEGFYRVVAHYGFMEEPSVPATLDMARERGFVYDPEDTTYFVGRESLIPTREPSGMAFWREKLFAVMSRNAQPATTYFKIPAHRVMEVGTQLKLSLPPGDRR